MSGALTLLRQAIANDAADIRTANGYRTDLGLDVDLEPVEIEGADAPRLLVAITEMEISEPYTDLRQRTGTLVLEASIPASCDTALGLAEDCIEDLLQRFQTVSQYVLSGGITVDVEQTGANIEARPAGLGGIVASVSCRFDMQEPLA